MLHKNNKNGYIQKNWGKYVAKKTSFHCWDSPLLSVLSLSTLIFISSSNLNAKELQYASTSPQTLDSDNDGLSDRVETQLGTERYLADTDGDGINDGEEVGSNISSPHDSDNDKRIDALDSDDDNDGLPTIFETQQDTDNDGTPNYLDTDSDNDGVSDGDEAGMTSMDMDGDGIDNLLDVDSTGGQDSNGDGIDDDFELPDSNNDGQPDYLDSKVKNISSRPLSKDELQSLTKNNPSKKPKKELIIAQIDPNLDQDHDGIPDVVEIKIGTNPKQRDSDYDHVADALEIGIVIDYPQDSDHDGIIDAMDEDDDGDGVLTRNEDPNIDGSPINDDTDGDGVPNYLDANDDGDMVLTIDEGSTLDTDQDGVLDYLDKVDGVDRSVASIKNERQLNDNNAAVKNFAKEGYTSPSKQNTNTQLAKHLDDADHSLRKISYNSNHPAMTTVQQYNKEANKPSESLAHQAMSWLASLLPN